LTPFVVGNEGGGDHEDGEDGEENLHRSSGQWTVNRDQGSGIRDQFKSWVEGEWGEDGILRLLQRDGRVGQSQA